MSYAAFQKAALAGTFAPRRKPVSLYQALPVADKPPEDAFVDGVVGNLKRGRALLLIVGDGIRSEAEVLLGNLENFARFQFTLALIELAVFRMPASPNLLVRPRTLAKTAIVRRHVFEDAAGGAVPSLPGESNPGRPETLSSDAFWQAREQTTPGAAGS